MYKFPVSLRPVYSHTGEVIPKIRNVFREDTSRSLGVLSDKYVLIKHEDVMDAANSFMSLLGKPEVKVSIHKEGAVLLAEYTFIDRSIAVSKNDLVGLRVYVENSYNGSSSLRFRIGAVVLKCFNGMVVTDQVTDFVVRHFGKVELSFPDVSQVVSIFNHQQRKWDKLSVIELEEVGYKQFAAKALEEGAITNAKALTAPSEGTTAWDLYNQFTYFLTRQENISEIGRINKLNKLAHWMEHTFLKGEVA